MTKDKFEQTFIINMISLRRASGLSQKEFAAEINATRDQVKNWEIHRGFPKLEIALNIAELFQVSVKEMGTDIITVRVAA